MNDTIFQQSDFFLNTVISQPFEDRPHVLQTLDRFFIISLIFLLFLALIKLNFYKSFTQSYKELVKSSYNSHAYSGNISQVYSLFLLLVICICVVSSLAFYLLFNKLYSQENTMLFIWTFIIVLFFIFMRFILVRMVGILFNMKNIISKWENLTIILNFIAAVLCFPFVFVAYYYSFWLFLALPLVISCFAFLFRFSRGWLIFKKGLKFYEYFLYFCTIEILPLLILLKFVNNRLLIV